MNDTTLFEFESDFVASLRCIPMAVRFKLDLAAIKVSLRQWSRFAHSERRTLLSQGCETSTEIRRYRAYLIDLIVERVGEAAKPLPEPACELWKALDGVPAAVTDQSANAGLAGPTRSQWAALSDLQRFALLKLTRPGHDNANFAPAMSEFGLASDAVRASRNLIRLKSPGARQAGYVG